jgi:class 3 adenylate cyclase/tetratricopeptide (TPR) repeat protein
MGRGVAVVLFTDLVGSTELRGRLGEEAADELRRKHDQLLAQAVESSKGRVLKGLGDGIMATFAGASDAVTAAVAIQQAVDRLNRSGNAAVPLAVRVGLSAGDVGFEDDDIHGTPVIEAARLCAAAGGGEILAAEVVRVLAGSSGEQRYAPVGPLELKGLDHPVAAVRVEWEPVTVSSIPMPQLLTDVGRIFVGRDAQLERLSQLWKEAVAGERRVALLAGEPGVGKTRLAAEVAIRVCAEGGMVLAGRCDEDLGVPYQPFVEALRHFGDNSSPIDLKVRLGRYGGELARLVPDLAERVPDLTRPLQSDPETERYRLFDAVAAWLSAASADEPLLLVLDDLQWAAKPTLMLLRHVARAPDARRLLILGTYRDTELTADHPLVEVVADLRRVSALQRLTLSGLDDQAVAAIVEQAAGQPMDDNGVALTRAIFEETEGNPFFVREVLRHLAETDAIGRAEGRHARAPIAQLGIPEGIRDVVGRRLSRLSDAANQSLRVAAVVGAEFEADLLQTACGLAEAELLAALDEAVDARLVTEVSPIRFRFSHALVRTTLYESLTGARKVAVHRHVAKAIEELRGAALDQHLPALAHHWARASAPGAHTQRAVDYAVRAGDWALTQLAHDEAAIYYRQALELLDAGGVGLEDPRRLEALISLGEAQRRAGNAQYRETLINAAHSALRVRDASRLCRAALANSRGFWSMSGGVDTERLQVLQAALEASQTNDVPTRARLLVTLAGEAVWSPGTDYQRLADEALELARSADDLGTLAFVLRMRCLMFLGNPGTLQQRLAETAELHTLAGRLGDPVLSFFGSVGRFAAALEAGDASEAKRCLDRVEALADELNQPLLRWCRCFERVTFSMLTGDFEAGERGLEEALALSEAASEPDRQIFHSLQLGILRLQQGRGSEVQDLLNELVAAAPSVPALRGQVMLHQVDSGCLDAVAPNLQSLCWDLEQRRDPSWSRGVAIASLLCGEVDDPAVASRLQALFAPYAGQFVGSWVFAFGAVDLYLGILSRVMRRFGDAVSSFSLAADLHTSMGSRPWLAVTHLEWGRALLLRGRADDRERAGGLLRQAAATARELGLVGVERKAVTGLEQHA